MEISLGAFSRFFDIFMTDFWNQYLIRNLTRHGCLAHQYINLIWALNLARTYQMQWKVQSE